MYLILIFLMCVTVEGLLPRRGKCVIAPKSFLQKNASLSETLFDVDPSCKRGIVNWQYPSHHILLHFKPHRSTFAVCFFNLGGANRLSFYDVTNGMGKPDALPPVPTFLIRRNSRRRTRMYPRIALRPMCVPPKGRELMIKVQTPKGQMYMAAFMYVTV